MVLIFILLNKSHSEHLFMFLCAMHIISLVKCPFTAFAHFLNYFNIDFQDIYSRYESDVNIWFANIISSSVTCFTSFCFNRGSEQTFSITVKSVLFFFGGSCFWCNVRTLQLLVLEHFFPRFFLNLL